MGDRRPSARRLCRAQSAAVADRSRRRKVLVCDMGRQRAIRIARIEHDLNKHAGSYIGVRQVSDRRQP